MKHLSKIFVESYSKHVRIMSTKSKNESNKKLILLKYCDLKKVDYK